MKRKKIAIEKGRSHSGQYNDGYIFMLYKNNNKNIHQIRRKYSGRETRNGKNLREKDPKEKRLVDNGKRLPFGWFSIRPDSLASVYPPYMEYIGLLNL